MYYFAYGSNMNHEQMSKRCPGSKFIKKTCLAGYKFVYDGYSSTWDGAVANIVRDANGKVWGGLFEIDERDLEALNRYEGYPHVYARETLRVRDETDNIYEALAYLRKEPQGIGKPSSEYRDTVIRGAKDCCLDEGYIEKVI